MATVTVEFNCTQDLILTLELYTPGTDTLVTSVSATERTNDKGSYYASLVDLDSGTYRARAKSQAGLTIGRGYLDHINTAGNEVIGDYASSMSSTLLTDIANALYAAGQGPRSVTITINDGSTVLESATVALSDGVNTYSQTTNASGVATFSLTDATYAVVISKAGYSFAATTLVVDGTESQTYSMTAISITAPALPDQSTGYLTCYDKTGAAVTGVQVAIKQTASGETTSYAFDGAERVVCSGAAGLLEITGLWQGATYKLRRGNGDWVSYTVPATTTCALPVVLSKP